MDRKDSLRRKSDTSGSRAGKKLAGIWDLAVEISSNLKHSFPMDILVRTSQAIAQRLQYGDFFIRDIMEKGKVLYERTGQ